MAQRPGRQRLLLLLAALVTLYILIPRLPSFENSFTTLLQADFAYICLGISFWIVSLLAAALVYKFIASKPVFYWPTVLVQLANGFTNRLVPLGAGAIATNARYLTKRGHTAVQAAALVAFNNMLGFVGNAILLLLALAVRPETLDKSLNFNISLPAVSIIIIIICLMLGVGFITRAGYKIGRKVAAAAKLLAVNVFNRPSRTLLALLSSMAITVSYTMVLYSMGLAFNAPLSIIQALYVLSVGVLAASVTPTPGGIGGAEAGLVAALISVGISSHQALTIALTYRFIVFWLPILPGFAAFRIALKRRYI